MDAAWAGIAAWDGVIALVLFASVVVGLWRGFIYESLALVNWVQAAVLASAFGGSVVAAVGLTGLSPQWQQVLGFVLVFVLALLLGGWLAAWVRRWVSRSGLRAPDRALGGLFGVLRGALVLVLMAMVVHGMALQGSPWWQASLGARWLDVGVVMVRGLWAPSPTAEEQ